MNCRARMDGLGVETEPAQYRQAVILMLMVRLSLVLLIIIVYAGFTLCG